MIYTLIGVVVLLWLIKKFAEETFDWCKNLSTRQKTNKN
jgi:hypothetical protein